MIDPGRARFNVQRMCAATVELAGLWFAITQDAIFSGLLDPWNCALLGRSIQLWAESREASVAICCF